MSNARLFLAANPIYLCPTKPLPPSVYIVWQRIYRDGSWQHFKTCFTEDEALDEIKNIQRINDFAMQKVTLQE